MAENIYVQRMREKRKQNNLCVACGKILDREGTMCIDCRQKATKQTNENRKWFQEHGICPRCTKEKLYGDEKNCINCRIKTTENTLVKRNKERYNKNHAEWSKRTHQEMIEKGICTRCRKRKADYGYKTCGICRAKDKEYKRMKTRNSDRKNRYAQGLCYHCDSPVKQGYKVCEEHYEYLFKLAHSDGAKKMRAKFQKGEYT